MILIPSVRLARVAALAAMLIANPLVASSVFATQWEVASEKSTITFSGTHAGRAFDGTFKSWTADITFDPNALDQAKADVRIDLASAETGDVTYDKTLPTADWFNIKAVAEGRFVTSSIKAVADDAYQAVGTLTIRGFDVPVTLDFTFAQDGDTAKLVGTTKLKRMDYEIGKGSDATGAWVSLNIPIKVDVSLKKAGGDVVPPKS